MCAKICANMASKMKRKEYIYKKIAPGISRYRPFERKLPLSIMQDMDFFFFSLKLLFTPMSGVSRDEDVRCD